MECRTCQLWFQIKDDDGRLPILDGKETEIGRCQAGVTKEVVRRGKVAYRAPVTDADDFCFDYKPNEVDCGL